ncbi:hypothetical protein L218DRAFT_1077500 [Marasmius fiardii PR-910]|nr:hypothetical protein L218DRAFT_1077500 [Marasmius fiardii PR-910]
MVFVNSRKFACESCIKGHRSSACAHTDRPLFEIKKKGRPISQCETCRSLRQSRKMHSKCVCSSSDRSKANLLPLPASAGAKAKRFIPIAPALPNGLKDLQSSSQCTITIPSDKRQRVTSLLNPCSCKDPFRCKCLKDQNHQSHSTSSPSSGNKDSEVSGSCCTGSNTESSKGGPHTRSTSPLLQTPSKRVKRQHHHQPHTHPHTHSHSHSPPPSIHLPPLLFPDLPLDSPPASGIPDFGTIPSLSEISSFAGSGCTCGVECNCPGCAEHRGPEYADTTICGSCSVSGSCGMCTDNTQGIALPGSGSHSSGTTSIIDRFFARAASLPEPPTNRKMGPGLTLDPMNVMVYPKTAIEMVTERGVPFGLITVPKLECCGGKCGCPEGQCGCGNGCDGCCVEHQHERGGGGVEGREKDGEMRMVGVTAAIASAMEVRSCCSGKT